MVWDTAVNGNMEIGTPDGPVKVSTSVFRDAVREAASVRGYHGQVKVFVGDDEIVDPDDAPEMLPTDEIVRIEPYNKAG